MFLIHEKEEAYESKACSECTENFSTYCGTGGCYDICEDCEEKIKTSFECPHCSTSHSFFGDDNPIYCSNCRKMLPNIINLKKSSAKRIDYYKRIGNV